MSYEGYTEYICPKGHHYEVDAMDVIYHDVGNNCPFCGSQPRFYHSVDETNGICEYDPGTYPAAVEIIGHEDAWFHDHYGNGYATKTYLVKPDDLEWKIYMLPKNWVPKDA